mmetsp:Transcript_44212/g.87210  ORF Transcript_44212/g.87210 Transcript_44212/m.87210 type:complete len:218 (-) Transcript_44212:214-867(-)
MWEQRNRKIPLGIRGPSKRLTPSVQKMQARLKLGVSVALPPPPARLPPQVSATGVIQFYTPALHVPRLSQGTAPHVLRLSQGRDTPTLPFPPVLLQVEIPTGPSPLPFPPKGGRRRVGLLSQQKGTRREVHGQNDPTAGVEACNIMELCLPGPPLRSQHPPFSAPERNHPTHPMQTDQGLHLLFPHLTSLPRKQKMEREMQAPIGPFCSSWCYPPRC